MRPSNALVLAGVTLALAACNNPDPNRTTAAPPGVRNPTAIVEPITTPSAPPAPAERGPIPPNANAAAPGTNAQLAFAEPTEQFASSAPPSKGGAPKSQEEAVKAQAAAADAANTAAADAAKEEATSGGNGARTSGTARDTAASSARHGTLTAHEESTQMPKAGQANNYSGPSSGTTSGGTAESPSK